MLSYMLPCPLDSMSSWYKWLSHFTSNESLNCPTLYASVSYLYPLYQLGTATQKAIIQATNKQADCMLLAFHGLLTAYNEVTHWSCKSKITSRLYDNQTAEDLFCFWQRSLVSVAGYTQSSCSIFHCHKITPNLAYNALVHTNGRFTKFWSRDENTLYTHVWYHNICITEIPTRLLLYITNLVVVNTQPLILFPSAPQKQFPPSV